MWGRVVGEAEERQVPKEVGEERVSGAGVGGGVRYDKMLLLILPGGNGWEGMCGAT